MSTDSIKETETELTKLEWQQKFKNYYNFLEKKYGASPEFRTKISPEELAHFIDLYANAHGRNRADVEKQMLAEIKQIKTTQTKIAEEPSIDDFKALSENLVKEMNSLIERMESYTSFDYHSNELNTLITEANNIVINQEFGTEQFHNSIQNINNRLNSLNNRMLAHHNAIERYEQEKKDLLDKMNLLIQELEDHPNFSAYETQIDLLVQQANTFIANDGFNSPNFDEVIKPIYNQLDNIDTKMSAEIRKLENQTTTPNIIPSDNSNNKPSTIDSDKTDLSPIDLSAQIQKGVNILKEIKETIIRFQASNLETRFKVLYNRLSLASKLPGNTEEELEIKKAAIFPTILQIEQLQLDTDNYKNGHQAQPKPVQESFDPNTALSAKIKEGVDDLKHIKNIMYEFQPSELMTRFKKLYFELADANKLSNTNKMELERKIAVIYPIVMQISELKLDVEEYKAKFAVNSSGIVSNSK